MTLCGAAWYDVARIMIALPRKLFLFSVLVAFLAACFEYDSVVHVNPDGSGRAEFAYRFPTGLLDKTDLAGKVPLTQKDVDARYRMRAGITQYRAEFRDLPNFREVRIYVEFDKVSSLSERGSTYFYGIEGPYKVYRVRIDRQSATANNPNQFGEKLVREALERYKIRYKVYLPNRIEQSNAQVVEWNAATWEIPVSVFLSPDKQVIVLEAKTRATLWERVKWTVGRLF